MPGYGQTPPLAGTLPWGPDQVAQPAVQPGPGNSSSPLWLPTGPLQRWDAASQAVRGQAPIYSRVHAAPVWSASNTSGAALSVTVAPAGVGDLMVVSVLNQGGTSVASLSGGGCASYSRVGTPWTDPETTPSILEFWWGVVTSTGSSSLSVTWNAPVGAHFNEVSAQDFRCNMAGTWTAEGTTNQSNGSSSTTVTFPAVTPTQPSEIYCGYASSPSALSVSSAMAGFVGGLTNGNDCFLLGLAYDGGGVKPTCTLGFGSTSWSIGACFYMVPAVAGGTAWTLAGTGDSTGADTASGSLQLQLTIAGTAPAASAASGAFTSPVPYIVGTLSTNATGTSFSVPVTTAMATGDGLLLGSSEPGAGVISAVSDSQGNQWAVQKSLSSTPSVSAWAITGGPSGGAVVPLTTSDTMSVTFSVNDSVFKEFLAVGVPGKPVPDTAGANTSSATSAAPSVATGTLAATGEMCVAFFSTANGGGTPTVTGPATIIGSTLHGGAGSYLTAGYLSASSTSAQTLAAAITSAANRNAVVPLGSAGSSTTWTLAGTADSTPADSASGTLALLMPLAGTAAGTSAASGTLPLLMGQLAGTAPAVSAGSGSLQLTLAIAGTAVSSTTGSGTLALQLALAGTSPAASSASGAFLPMTIAGNAPTVSAASGQLRLTMPLAGTAPATSAGSGSFALVLTGTAAGASAASGSLALQLVIAGTAAQTSVASGAWLPLPLAGTAAGASTAAGTFTLTLALAGTAAKISAASGALTLLMPLAGTAAQTSGASGALALVSPLAGTSPAVSSAAGSLALVLTLAGTGASTSAGSGQLGGVTLAGTSAGQSVATGAFLPATLAGTAAGGQSVASGTLTLLIPLAGTATGQSVATGALLPASLAGTAAQISAAAGALRLTMPLAGSAPAASVASGAFTLTLALAGTAAGASAAGGALGGVTLAGTAAGISTAAGTLQLLAGLAGTAGSASAGTGNLAWRAAIAGTAASVSGGTGTLLATLTLTATAAALTQAAGTLGIATQLQGSCVAYSAALGVLLRVAPLLAGTGHPGITRPAAGGVTSVRTGPAGDPVRPGHSGGVTVPRAGAAGIAGTGTVAGGSAQ